MQIRSMHNDSTIVGTYLDNVTKYDNGRYPYNIMSIMVLNGIPSCRRGATQKKLLKYNLTLAYPAFRVSTI